MVSLDHPKQASGSLRRSIGIDDGAAGRNPG